MIARDVKSAGIQVDKEEQYEKFFVEKDEDEPKSILEQYFGIHFRIEEGVVEFYRREERFNNPVDSMQGQPGSNDENFLNNCK